MARAGSRRLTPWASRRRGWCRTGWTRKVEGRRQYLFAPEVFRAEVCAGLDWRAVLEALRRRGRLVAADGRNRALKLRGIGRVYAIWEEATDED